jgi:hypothetical protein
MAKPRTWFNHLVKYTDAQVRLLNTSKVFAGLMVMTINIASKFVKFKFSPAIDNYLKHTFSRDILVFCIVWMGCRDIYIAAATTAVFMVCAELLFNENSAFCILPESFVQFHQDAPCPSDEEVAAAQEVLQRKAACSDNPAAR